MAKVIGIKVPDAKFAEWSAEAYAARLTVPMWIRRIVESRGKPVNPAFSQHSVAGALKEVQNQANSATAPVTRLPIVAPVEPEGSSEIEVTGGRGTYKVSCQGMSFPLKAQSMKADERRIERELGSDGLALVKAKIRELEGGQ